MVRVVPQGTRAEQEAILSTLNAIREIATYEARLEILFDHRDMGELLNPLLATAGRLAKLTSGVVYESSNGVFQ